MDINRFKSVMSARKPKLIYTVPNFQNPSGLSFSEDTRQEMADIVRGTQTLLIEDDPYGDLRYFGSRKSSFKKFLPDNTILFGTFSKTVAPGFRLGWIVAPHDIMEKLIVAKQAADLHTTHFTQCILWQYMNDNDIDAHIRKIKACYGRQMQAMLNSIEKYFPEGVAHTTPEAVCFCG